MFCSNRRCLMEVQESILVCPTGKQMKNKYGCQIELVWKFDLLHVSAELIFNLFCQAKKEIFSAIVMKGLIKFFFGFYRFFSNKTSDTEKLYKDERKRRVFKLMNKSIFLGESNIVGCLVTSICEKILAVVVDPSKRLPKVLCEKILVSLKFKCLPQYSGYLLWIMWHFMFTPHRCS